MANLADSAVTVNNSWTEGSVTGKRRRVLECTVVLSGQGGATNLIKATNFGLKKIEESKPAVLSDDTEVYLSCPSYDGTKLFLLDVSNATDGTRAAPADVTGTVRITVKGY